MPAKVTIELDDRTAQGFADVVRNATAAEGATQELGQAMAELVKADQTVEGLKLKVGELEGKLGKSAKAAKQTGQSGNEAFQALAQATTIVDPRIGSIASQFVGLGGTVGKLGPTVGKAFALIGGAIGPVALAVGGISLAMQLFGDDAEAAGEQAAEAFRKQEEAARMLADAQREIADTRRQIQTLQVGLPEELQAQVDLNRAKREQARLEQEIAGVRRQIGFLPKEREAAKTKEIADLENQRLQMLQQEKAAQAALQQIANRRLEAREREHDLAQSLADERIIESDDLEAIRAQRQQILDELEDKQRKIHAFDIESNEFNANAVADLQRERDKLARRAEQFATAEQRILRDQARERKQQQEEFDQLRKKAHQEALKEHQAELEAARQKFQTEVDLLRQKLLEEQQLREGVRGEARSAFQRLAGGVSREEIVQQIAVQRTLSGEDRIGRGPRARRAGSLEDLNRHIRRELARGEIDAAEIQQAQAQVLADQAGQAASRGLLDKRNAEALRQLAEGFADEARANLDMEQRLQQIEKAIGTTRDSAARQRAQRRTNRG